MFLLSTGRWPYDWSVCNLWVTFDVLTCSASILHMCFISVGRYLGIRNPLHARYSNLFVSRRAVLWRIALAWISAMLIASPITMMSLYDHRNIVPNPTECAISNKYFLIIGSLLAFFIPMFVMVPTYVMTVRLLSQRAKFVRSNSLITTATTATTTTTATATTTTKGAASKRKLEPQMTTPAAQKPQQTPLRTGSAPVGSSSWWRDHQQQQPPEKTPNLIINFAPSSQAGGWRDKQEVGGVDSGMGRVEVDRKSEEAGSFYKSYCCCCRRRQSIVERQTEGRGCSPERKLTRVSRVTRGDLSLTLRAEVSGAGNINSRFEKGAENCSIRPKSLQESGECLADRQQLSNGCRLAKGKLANSLLKPESPNSNNNSSNSCILFSDSSSCSTFYPSIQQNHGPTAAIGRLNDSNNNNQASVLGTDYSCNESIVAPETTTSASGVQRRVSSEEKTTTDDKLGDQVKHKRQFARSNDISIDELMSGDAKRITQPASLLLCPNSAQDSRAREHISISVQGNGHGNKANYVVSGAVDGGAKISPGCEELATGKRRRRHNHKHRGHHKHRGRHQHRCSAHRSVEKSSNELATESTATSGIEATTDGRLEALVPVTRHHRRHHKRHKHHHHHHNHLSQDPAGSRSPCSRCRHHCLPEASSETNLQAAARKSQEDLAALKPADRKQEEVETDKLQRSSLITELDFKSNALVHRTRVESLALAAPMMAATIAALSSLKKQTQLAQQLDRVKARAAGSSQETAERNGSSGGGQWWQVNGGNTNNSNNSGDSGNQRTGSGQQQQCTSYNFTSSTDTNEPQMIRCLGSSLQVRSEQKATKVLGVVFFTFVVCWTPFFVINFAQAFVDRAYLAQCISNQMMSTFMWLGYISSTINPIIYTVFNRNFRRAFRRVLLCQPPASGSAGDPYWLRSRNSELNKTNSRMSHYGQRSLYGGSGSRQPPTLKNRNKPNGPAACRLISLNESGPDIESAGAEYLITSSIHQLEPDVSSAQNEISLTKLADEAYQLRKNSQASDFNIEQSDTLIQRETLRVSGGRRRMSETFHLSAERYLQKGRGSRMSSGHLLIRQSAVSGDGPQAPGGRWPEEKSAIRISPETTTDDGQTAL